MRILHTADWHVGKTLKGRSRLEEQERVLREIVTVSREQEVDAVLVAGDLYDTAAPSAEAQRLVMRALVGLARDGAAVVAIAGNHDHARALEAYRPLAEPAGITLVGEVRTAEKGGVVELTARTGERARLAVLPFLSQRYAVTAADLVTGTAADHTAEYDQQLRTVLAGLTAGFGADTVNLVTAHLTVRDGVFGGGERAAQSIFEYAVPASIFPVDAHYVALGHLHRRQQMPAACPVHYSGAPLAVDFGEQENRPMVCIVDVTPSTPAQVTDVPITSGRRLRTVTGTVAELAAMADDLGDDLLRVRVREPARAGLRDDVTDLLPHALEVRIDPEFAAPLTVARPRTGPERHPSELFAEYLTDHGIADARVNDLFRRIHDDVTGSR